MHNAIWIVLGVLLAWIVFQAMRGVRAGKRERKRLEALFERVTRCACPLCGKPFGSSLREGIHLDLLREYHLPPTLAELELSTWQIICPNCQGSAVLVEDDNHFEVLAARIIEPKRVSPAYVTLVAALTLAAVGVSIYSIVRLLMK